jgi:alpha-D-xyloside xylohydrolase
VWDDELLPTWVRYTRIHAGLVDYLQEAHAAYRATGRPIMAALELVHPDEPLMAGVDDQYYLGPELLVAPVLEPGLTQRRVVVPPGRWQDAFRSESAAVEGPVALDLAVTVEDIPVLRREGSAVSLATD